MKIQIASDLHCEHYKKLDDILYKFPIAKDSLNTDLYLAGDILSFAGFSEQEIFYLFNWFCQRYNFVYYVPGNHEFHGTNGDKINLILLELEIEFKNLMWLTNSRIFRRYNDRVLGGTLWFPPVKGFEYKESTLNTGWIHQQNLYLCNFLWNHIRPSDIIMTHHPPHWRSIPKSIRNKEKYKNFGKFFMTELEHLILSKQPKLWIHGHSHVPVDYMLGATRIISNPYGYPSENKHKKSFRQGVIEI